MGISLSSPEDRIYQEKGEAYMAALRKPEVAGNFAAAAREVHVTMATVTAWARDPLKRYQLSIVAQAHGNRDGASSDSRDIVDFRAAMEKIQSDPPAPEWLATIRNIENNVAADLKILTDRGEKPRDCLLAHWYGHQRVTHGDGGAPGSAKHSAARGT